MPGLMPGDRIPDFARPGADGKPRLFHDFYYGQPLALFVCGPASSPQTRADIQALDQGDAEWHTVTRVALVIGAPADCVALSAGLKNGLTVLADDGSLCLHLLGTPPTGLTAFVLDENLRVSARMERGGDAAAFVQELSKLYATRPRPLAKTLQQQAPVLFIPRVFDAAFCEGLIGHFEETGGTPSGVAYVQGDQAAWKPDPSVKLRRDVYLQEGPWLERVKDALLRRVLPEIHRCFNYAVTQHEVFKLIRYDAATGGYFRPHRDNESRDTRHRRFAMTLNLNTGAYEGGELHFPEFGPDLYAPERGGAALFSCSLLHEVKPVTRGSRYALLGFFFSDVETMAQTQYTPER